MKQKNTVLSAEIINTQKLNISAVKLFPLEMYSAKFPGKELTCILEVLEDTQWKGAVELFHSSYRNGRIQSLQPCPMLPNTECSLMSMLRRSRGG